MKNNLDIAMLLTDAILNKFEKNGKCIIPLDESFGDKRKPKPYSWNLQDVIQLKLEKIFNEDKKNKGE